MPAPMQINGVKLSDKAVPKEVQLASTDDLLVERICVAARMLGLQDYQAREALTVILAAEYQNKAGTATSLAEVYGSAYRKCLADIAPTTPCREELHRALTNIGQDTVAISDFALLSAVRKGMQLPTY